MKKKPIIAVLDSDPIQHFILEKWFLVLSIESEIKSFYSAEQLISYLTANLDDDVKLPDLILMEIHLPMKDGWSFLDHLLRIKDLLVKFPSVVVVSNSIDSREIELAVSNPLVTRFIEKPLDKSKISLIRHFLVNLSEKLTEIQNG